MSAAEILAAIDEAAATQLAQIATGTESRLAAIHRETEAAAQQQHERARLQATSDLAGELALRGQQTHLQAGRAYQKARAQQIAAVLNAAEERLATLRETEAYPEVYGRLLHEALILLEREDGLIVIRADPRDQSLLERLLREGDISVSAIKYDLVTAGGAIISNVGDYILIDNTLETRFERAQAHLQQEVAEFLGLPDELRGADAPAGEAS